MHQTLWHLSCQRRGDGNKVEVRTAVVDGHLLALAHVKAVAVALVAELIQREPAVH